MGGLLTAILTTGSRTVAPISDAKKAWTVLMFQAWLVAQSA